MNSGIIEFPEDNGFDIKNKLIEMFSYLQDKKPKVINATFNNNDFAETSEEIIKIIRPIWLIYKIIRGLAV